MTRLLALMSILALSACADFIGEPSHGSSQPGKPKTVVASYNCADGTAMSVAFLSRPPSVVVHFADNSVLNLPQVIAADGARYSDGRHTFWSKGVDALYFKAPGAQTSCRPKI